ncbi:MAG: hypothetical protein PHG67_13025 [Bacteroidales bacterium]|jgi:hypothetical protein|nr:hypothetical protein [Bacteroidales bacterium]
MFQIIQNPPILSLQGLPLIYRLEADRDEPFFKVLARVSATNTYEAASRNQSNIATFDLREYFETLLQTSLVLDANHIHPDGCKNFTIRFYEYFGNPPSAQNEITASPTICIGRVPAWKQLEFDIQNTNFGAYQAISRLLSWFPIGQTKRVLPDQPELMYLLWPNATYQNIAVTIYFSDESTALLNIEHLPVPPLTVASFPVGYQALGIGDVNPAKTVVSYEVTIADQTRVFVVDHNLYRQHRFLIFRNSLGGFDTLACMGEADESTEVERKQSTRVYDAENPYRQRKSEFYNEHSELVKVNSGWLSPEEKNWLNDLLISTEVYEVRSNKLQPVLIKNKSIDRSWRIYEPGSIEIEFERINFVL